MTTRSPSVFVFNPFAEGYIARGNAFTPAKHQARLAEDLANLPQFLGQPDDIVLLPKRPAVDFLNVINEAGFALPEFVELRAGRIEPGDSLCRRELGSLRPWAWGPDSVRLFEPLFAATREARTRSQYYNGKIAQLYSKAWSAGFLGKVLARQRGHGADCGSAAPKRKLAGASAESILCSEDEVGVAVDTLEDALEVIAAIRGLGHHRVVVKEAFGVAGQNSIRLWEPQILPAQRKWLAHDMELGREFVIEPWLPRELDFSVQLEMEPRGLKVCGYTGLVNDLKGQFLGNWAEADYARSLPAEVTALLGGPADGPEQIRRLYEEIFTLLEAELRRVGFLGPVSIDGFVYRAPRGDCRLKPVVEINPRYTMGRLAVELMKHTRPGSRGRFRLVTPVQARAAGCASLSRYASTLRSQFPLRLEGGSLPRIRQGALCLNDPGLAQAVLATFEVSPRLHPAGGLRGNEPTHSLGTLTRRTVVSMSLNIAPSAPAR